MDRSQATPRFPARLGALALRSTPLLRTDVLVVGGGVAGAAAALHAAAQGAEVLVLSKSPLEETNTSWAQGGIAVSLLPGDSTELHTQDTLAVGAGLADESVVRAITSGAKGALQWLESLGTSFDRAEGQLALSREGAHSIARVVHSNGDATGAEMQRALKAAMLQTPNVTLRTNAFVRDLMVVDGNCVGAVVTIDGVELAVEAGAVVMASGGCGQIYRETTNPTGASGDGHALCFRAGAQLADMEFVQFHPTTLYIAGAARSLISEVVRGAGAHLIDRNGTRFMPALHPMAELAPRDVVSRAILDQMVATGDTNVYLDLRPVSGDAHKRFPSISRICSGFDIDIARDPIPVRPGAHYFVGGVVTDEHARTSVQRLYAVGEVASTGLHGANRLASNSLLEGAVMGARAGAHAATTSRSRGDGLPRSMPGPELAENPPRIIQDDLLYSLKSLMWRQVGLKRDAAGLEDARSRIGFWHHYLMRSPLTDRRAWELANMLTVAALVTESSLRREESRGTHFRNDHTTRDDRNWRRRILLQRTQEGTIGVALGPLTLAGDPR
ncbi:MAG: L-aspartate oxidase [Planctomycetota bacterium]